MTAKREGIYIMKPKIMVGSVPYNRRIHKCVWKNTILENIVLYQLARTKQNHVIFTDMILVLTMISNSHLNCPNMDLIRRRFIYDDVIKWKHFPRYWPFVRGIHRSPMNSPHKGQWRGALMFSLICTWINAWVNNREAGDLRRHRAHSDAIVMNNQSFV